MIAVELAIVFAWQSTTTILLVAQIFVSLYVVIRLLYKRTKIYVSSSDAEVSLLADEKHVLL
jgi:hypothetical protein